MSLSKLWETGRDREAWPAAHGVQKVGHNCVTELFLCSCLLSLLSRLLITKTCSRANFVARLRWQNGLSPNGFFLKFGRTLRTSMVNNRLRGEVQTSTHPRPGSRRALHQRNALQK